MTDVTYTWQYNGKETFSEVTHWCMVNLDNRTWLHDWETIYFQDEQAYLLFMLRWA